MEEVREIVSFLLCPMEGSHRIELVMMSFRHLFVKNERIVKQCERWPFRAAVGDAFLLYFSKEGLC